LTQQGETTFQPSDEKINDFGLKNHLQDTVGDKLEAGIDPFVAKEKSIKSEHIRNHKTTPDLLQQID
jgi:hypothetical protein